MAGPKAAFSIMLGLLRSQHLSRTTRPAYAALVTVALSALPVFCLVSELSAQDPARSAPRLLSDDGEGGRVSMEDGFEEAEADDTPLVPQLKGIVLWGDPNAVVFDGLPGVTGTEARGLVIPAPSQLEISLEPFIGQPFSLAALQDITRTIILHFRSTDRPVVDVIVPEQDLTPGVLQLVILEGRVGAVTVRGNRWFSEDRILGEIHAQEGDPIQQSELLSDLDWLNRNPFRRVDLVYSPGTALGATDLILDTQDRFPLRLYAGIENTGTEIIGEEILLAGFNWGNVFGWDHLLSYQFTFTPDLEGLISNSAVYEAPLPWRHRFRLLGLSAQTQSEDTSTATLDTQGESSQISGRYEIPFRSSKTLNHALVGGFDYKSTNNNLEFGGAGVFDSTTDIFQFSAQYLGLLSDDWGSTRFDTTLVWSPGNWSPANSDERFGEARPLAESAYLYGRAEVERLVDLPRESALRLQVTGQVSSENLLASEQLGAGGYRSVRGYEEYEVRGDEGLLATLELLAPPIPVASLLGLSSVRDQLQLLAFWDYGWVSNKHSLPGEPSSIDLMSVGAGLRYEIAPYCFLRLDYGIQLKDSGIRSEDNSRLHFGLQIGN